MDNRCVLCGAAIPEGNQVCMHCPVPRVVMSRLRLLQPGARQTDLFETLRRRVGCEQISDLRYPPFRGAALRQIAKLPAAAFPLSEWQDAVHYFTGAVCRFPSVGEAKEFLTE